MSMSPIRAPAPRLTAYEPAVVALIARMSHWHAPSGSGPVETGTPYSAAQVAFSAAGVGVTVARDVKRTGLATFCPNQASWATPTTAPDWRSRTSNLPLEDVTVAIPSLLTLRTLPPAWWTAAMPAAECAVLKMTM